MNNVLEYSYMILRFNYGIVFFSASILIFFFASTISKIFSERKDLYSIISASEKTYVKFDFNGIIIDYNEDFAELATIHNEDIRGVDIFTLISFDDYDELTKVLFNSIDSDKNSSFTSNVTCKNGEVKKILFKGIRNTNYFGAGYNYILVGTDVTATDKIDKKQKYDKTLLDNLTVDYRFAEEELKRNFQQIQAAQFELEELKEKHTTFLDTLPIGVIEYDFRTRQLTFSQAVLGFFLPNATASSIHPDEAIKVFFNFITKDSIYDFLEALYSSFHNNNEIFTYKLNINNSSETIRAKGTITYKNDKPLFLSIIIQSSKNFF